MGQRRGLVEEHTGQLRVAAQRGAQQSAAAPADVHDRAGRGERIHGRHRLVDRGGQRGHPVVEEPAGGRIRQQMLEEGRPEEPLEGRAVVPYGLGEGGRGPQEQLVGHHHDGGVQRVGDVGTQGSRGRRQVVGARGVLPEDAAGGEVAQYAAQMRGVGAGGGGELLGGARALGELVGDAVVRRGAQGGGEDMAHGLVHQVRREVSGLAGRSVGGSGQRQPPVIGLGVLVPVAGRMSHGCSRRLRCHEREAEHPRSPAREGRSAPTGRLRGGWGTGPRCGVVIHGRMRV